MIAYFNNKSYLNKLSISLSDRKKVKLTNKENIAVRANLNITLSIELVFNLPVRLC